MRSPSFRRPIAVGQLILLVAVAAPAFGDSDVPPALPAPVTNTNNTSSTTAQNNQTGTDVTTTTQAAVTGGTVPSVVTAGQGMQADPFSPGNRAQWQQATNNALMANQLLGKAAASGKYNTEKLDAQRALWAAQMMLGLNNSKPAASNNEGGQRPTRSGQGGSALAPQNAGAQQNNSSQIVNIAGGASDPGVIVVSSSTTVNLRFSNPNVPAGSAAEYILKDVKDAVPLMALSYGTEPTSAGGLFVSRVFDSIRSSAKGSEGDKPASTAPDGKTGEDNVRLDESAARGLPSSSAATMPSDATELTQDQKDVLKEVLKKKLEKLAEQATPENLAKESPERAEFLAAVKSASREPSVFDKLAEDIADSVQNLALNDRHIGAYLSKRAADRDRERKLTQFRNAGAAEPMRSIASDGSVFANWELDFSNGKGLILAAIIGILGLLFWTSRTKGQETR